MLAVLKAMSERPTHIFLKVYWCIGL